MPPRSEPTVPDGDDIQALLTLIESRIGEEGDELALFELLEQAESLIEDLEDRDIEVSEELRDRLRRIHTRLDATA